MRLSVLQALSIDRLFDLSGLDEYVIVLNGADNAALKREMLNHLEGRISQTLRSKMRFIAPKDLPRGGDGSGWHGQQAIKLGLADAVATDTYLLLDAKNHFVRPASITDFFHEGKPATVFSETQPNWETYVRASLEALDVYSEDQAARMMPTTTPYLMLTDEVRELIDKLERKYDKPLLQAMRSTVWGTEFFLYYAHLVSTGKPIPYTHAPAITHTLFTTWPQDPAVVMSIIEGTSAKNVPMFGLHRNRLPQLTEDQRTAISEMWGRYLLADWEDPGWFMAY